MATEPLVLTIAENVQELIKKSNSEGYRELLRSRDQDAQELLDLFQWLLNQDGLRDEFRRQLIVAMQRISANSLKYPACYELKGTIYGAREAGYGGFADIYQGKLADIYKGKLVERSVCMKVMRVYASSDKEKVLKAFSKEAVLWGQLCHPNILSVYGLYQFYGRPCLVAPWMENGHVLKYLKKNPEAPRDLLSFDVAQGLFYLHQMRIVHGDLKGVKFITTNILVDNQGVARVADFGLSSISDPEIVTLKSHSGASSKGGTVRWQAPELFDIESDAIVKNSESTDIYAFGCVCYEIYTGCLPLFELGIDPVVVTQVQMGKRPSRPPWTSPPWNNWGLTEETWQIMEDCWRTEPSKRPTLDKLLRHFQPIETDERMKDHDELSPHEFRTRLDKKLPKGGLLTRVLDKLALQYVDRGVTKWASLSGDRDDVEMTRVKTGRRTWNNQ